MGIGLQMLEVAIGWEVYAQHGSPLDLGWIGLAEFVPMFVLALPGRAPGRPAAAAAGVRRPRCCSARPSASGWPRSARRATRSVLPYLALAAGAGVTTALGNPGGAGHGADPGAAPRCCRAR